MPHIISIFDPNLNKLAEIDDYLYFAWRRKWRRPDEWQMEINRYARGTEYINPENLIVFQRTARSNGTVTENRVGRIEYMELALGESGKLSENWKLRGGAYSGIFDHRIALHDTNVGTGYDVQSGAAETVMRHYVDANCISATDLDRIVPMLTLASDQARGPSVSYRARFQYISQILEELSIYSGLGYEVEVDFDAGQFVFTVYEGRNLSPDNGEGNSPVIFSPEFGNVKLLNYRYSTLDSKDIAIVAGQGEGANRIVIPVVKDVNTRLEYTEDFTTGIHNNTEASSANRLDLALGTKYETDFSEYAPGVKPSDWTMVYNNSTWIAEDDLLRHSAGTLNATKYLTWDVIGNQVLHGEILVKCKSSVTGYNQIELGIRVGGGVDTENMYNLEFYDGTMFYVGKIVNGVWTWLRSEDFSWYADTWYWIRFRVVGNNLRARAWLDGTDEPSYWPIDVIDAVGGHPVAGMVGIGNYTAGNSEQRFDYFSFQEIDLQLGAYTSDSINYSYLRFLRESIIKWDEDAPVGTSVTVEHQVNDGAWLTCTNGQPLPGISIGEDLNGKSGKLRVTLDPGSELYAPSISNLNIIINGKTQEGAYSGTERREAFVDARDLATSGQLIQRGNERLAEYGVEEVMECDVLSGAQAKHIVGYEAAEQSFRKSPSTWITGSEEYANVQATPEGHLTLIALNGYDILKPFKITDVEKGLSSTVIWDEITPGNSDIKIYVGLCTDACIRPPSWYEVANGGAIPFINNLSIKNRYLWLKAELETDNMNDLPELIRLDITITGQNAKWETREGTFTYLLDWKCGDIVRAEYPEIANMDARIVEVLEEYDDQGERQKIVLGKQWPDLWSVTRIKGKNTDPEIRR